MNFMRHHFGGLLEYQTNHEKVAHIPFFHCDLLMPASASGEMSH